MEASISQSAFGAGDTVSATYKVTNDSTQPVNIFFVLNEKFNWKARNHSHSGTATLVEANLGTVDPGLVTVSDIE